jgi:hypothetical protein
MGVRKETERVYQGQNNANFVRADLLVERNRCLQTTDRRIAGQSNNKRIVLIKPPLYTCETFSPIRSSQPLGIWQLGSFLQSRGYEVRIIDSVIEGWGNKTYLSSGARFDFSSHLAQKVRDLHSLDSEQFLEKHPVTDAEGRIARTLVRTGLAEDAIADRIRDFDPGWIGISIIATCEHRSAMDLAKRLRREFPAATIVAGGQHATAMAGTVLADSEASIDFVVMGNGELAMEALLEGRNPGQGLAYTRNGALVEQPDSPLTPMDVLPPLDPLLLAHVPYPLPATHSYGTMNRKYTDWMLSFGCHKACDFCVEGLVKSGYRHLSLSQVEAQLRTFREHGYEELILQDDSLLGGPKNDGKAFFLETIRLFKKYGFHWHDNGGVEFERLDSRVVDEILQLNSQPGEGSCTALYVPFNPRYIGDNRALDRHRDTKPENIELLRRLKENGVYTFTSWIWGHVDQSVEDMQANTRSYEELLSGGYIDQAIIFGLSYLPRTIDWMKYKQHIVDLRDWEGYSIFVPHAGTIKASFKEVNLAVLDAYRRLNRLQPHVEPWAYGFPPIVPEGWGK